MEIWKDVVGYEGWYEVSNMGRVRNKQTKHIRELWKNKKGYCLIRLYYKAKSKSFHVHRLVATAFIGKPQFNQQINHKNGVKAFNRPENLEWVTQSENIQHAHNVLNVLFGARGEKHGLAKLKDAEVSQIKKLLTKGELSQKKIAALFNISPSTISGINTKSAWSHM